MSTSVTIVSARIAYALSRDLVSTRRVVRTLVTHPDLPESTYLLPIGGDEFRLTGLTVSSADVNERWMPVDKQPLWRPGQVPVGVASDGELLFWTRRNLEHHRLTRLSADVSEALTSDAPLLSRVSSVEHADAQMGGHPVSTSALLYLAETHPNEPALGSVDRLKRRFHSTAPDGILSLQRELGRPLIKERLADDIADRLVNAARRAAELNGIFAEDSWRSMKERTLWSWWLHWKAGAQLEPLRSIAHKLQLSPADCLAIGRGEAEPSDIGAEDRFPTRERAIRDLSRSMQTRPSQRARVAYTQRAHVPRLALFVRQTASLERIFGSERLTQWAETRDHVNVVRDGLTLRRFAYPWQAGEMTAEALSGLLRLGGFPLQIPTVLNRLGVQLAGTVLPFEQQQGTWHVEPDAAPVLFLTPSALTLSSGALRFAVLHQIGHLVAGHQRGCTKWVDDGPIQKNHEEEAFANAFAAYLTAPKTEVVRLVGRPRAVPDDWLRNAARDVALQFGLGPDAALPHVLNCLGRTDVKTRSPEWAKWRLDANDVVSSAWHVDADWIRESCASLDRSGVDAALSRPVTPAFDEALSRAVDHELLDAALQGQYGPH